jgi:DNA-binding HxlR family transcriptional regulator
MNYQRKLSAGLVDKVQIDETAQRLKCVLASLEPLSVINPFAPLIELPESIPHPRKTLLLLLDFINVVTFFFQHQRERVVNEQTGEFYIQTAPEDIELAFKLLKTSLLRKADDLSTSGRGFLSWLKKYLLEAKTNQFTALDIRKAKTIHPRTLNRYLQELNLFHYIQITGGNKHRGGFIYKLTELNELTALQSGIETSLKNTIEKINGKPSNESEQVPTEKPKLKTVEPSNETAQAEPTFFDKNYKRIRINDKEEHTYKLILELEAKEPNREYLTSDLQALSKRSQTIEARYLKLLWEQGKLTREWRNRQYYYRLTTISKTVSQIMETNTQNH